VKALLVYLPQKLADGISRPSPLVSELRFKQRLEIAYADHVLYFGLFDYNTNPTSFLIPKKSPIAAPNLLR
jgi:hypothetical protein